MMFIQIIIWKNLIEEIAAGNVGKLFVQTFKKYVKDTGISNLLPHSKVLNYWQIQNSALQVSYATGFPASHYTKTFIKWWDVHHWNLDMTIPIILIIVHSSKKFFQLKSVVIIYDSNVGSCLCILQDNKQGFQILIIVTKIWNLYFQAIKYNTTVSTLTKD